MNLRSRLKMTARNSRHLTLLLGALLTEPQCLHIHYFTASRPESPGGLITCPTRPYLLIPGVKLLSSIAERSSGSSSSPPAPAFAPPSLQPALKPKHLPPSTSAAWTPNHKTTKMKAAFLQAELSAEATCPFTTAALEAA